MPDINALIQRWQAGDERAAEALYNYHRETVFRLACGLLGDRDDAEEVAQDVLVYALMHIARYDPARASLRTWLHTITVSRCRDRQRRRYLPGVSLAAWLQQGGNCTDPTSNPERHAVQQEARSEVWQAVQALSPPLREAILLRYWAGHTYQEVAIIMRCPIPTAKSRVRLAYERLQVALAPVSPVDLEEEWA